MGAPEVNAVVLNPSSGFLVPLSSGQSLGTWLVTARAGGYGEAMLCITFCLF